jgi:hypothetical protein
MSRLSIVAARSVHRDAPQGQYVIRVWWDKGYMFLGTIEKQEIWYATRKTQEWVIYDRTGEPIEGFDTLREARAKAQEHFANA